MSETTIHYGGSGVGKTTNIGKLAEYVAETTGLVTRLVTADGGGYAPLEPHIKAGLIEVWEVNNEAHPIEALDFACQGYWPDRQSKKFTKSGLERVGGYAFEGLTSFGDLIMAHLRRTKARLSQDPSYVLKDGETEFAGGNMTYYGFVQDRLYDLVLKTKMLPVGQVCWTALEGKGEEEGTRVPVYGPAIAGKKSIGKAPQWFGNCLHSEMLVTEKGIDPKTKQGVLETKPVMYLKPHADPMTKLTFPAKTRAPIAFVADVPTYLDPPDLKALLKLMDGFRQKGTEELTKFAAQYLKPPVGAAKVQ